MLVQSLSDGYVYYPVENSHDQEDMQFMNAQMTMIRGPQMFSEENPKYFSVM